MLLFVKTSRFIYNIVLSRHDTVENAMIMTPLTVSFRRALASNKLVA
jgi:hypothetical protein